MSRLSRTALTRTSLVVLPVALSLVTASCSKLPDNTATGSGTAPQASSAVKDGGKLTLAMTSPMESWNPISADGDTTGQRQQQWPFYPHPFLMKPDSTVVLNEALLESAKVVSQSPMKVEYKIKANAVWSDGTPITGKDFKYTQAVQDPRQCKPCKAAFTMGYSAIESIDAPGDGKTVTMTYTKPFAQWQQLFNYILPAHVAETYGSLETSFNEGFVKNTPKVSGGPYLVKEYKKGVALTMEKNPKWYGAPAHLDTVIIRYITSASEQVTALQNGEVDMVYQIPTMDNVTAVKRIPGVKVDVGQVLTYYHLGFKPVGDPMSDAKLRKAILQALNTEDIRKRTAGQFAPNLPVMKSAAYVPGQSFQGVPAYTETTDKVGVGKGDVEAAKKTLTEAGYKIVDNKLIRPDGKPLPSLKVLTLATDQMRMQMAQIVQAQLAPLGITTTIDAADSARYSPVMRQGAFDIMATGTAPDLGSLSLAQWYQTKAARSFGYSSPVADDLFAKAEQELDPAKQVALMRQLDEVLIGDGVVLPLFQTPQMLAVKDTYTNIFVNPSKYGTTMNIEEWGLKK